MNILEHLADPQVNKNITIRRRIKEAAYGFLTQAGFAEFDTPVLVPLQGEVYNDYFNINGEMMLADSPQIYKQFLMFAGFEKYFQFAHCFRRIEHESNKHTRLQEFMQIDVEMAGLCSLSDLSSLVELLLIKICETVEISIEVKRISGIECREHYCDEFKPILKCKDSKLSVVIIEKMPLYNGEKTIKDTLIPCHHIFALPSEDIRNTTEEYLKSVTTESFDIVINGIEVGGGDLRICDRKLQERLMDIFSVDKRIYTAYLDALNEFKGKQNGGFAIGLERLIMALTESENVNKTVCFPY